MKKEQQLLQQQQSLLNVNYQSETVANINKRKSQIELKIDHCKFGDEVARQKKVLPGLQKGRILPSSFQTVSAPKQ